MTMMVWFRVFTGEMKHCGQSRQAEGGADLSRECQAGLFLGRMACLGVAVRSSVCLCDLPCISVIHEFQRKGGLRQRAGTGSGERGLIQTTSST